MLLSDERIEEFCDLIRFNNCEKCGWCTDEGCEVCNPVIQAVRAIVCT